VQPAAGDRVVDRPATNSELEQLSAADQRLLTLRNHGDLSVRPSGHVHNVPFEAASD
jgi:hypothetical protein